MRGHKLVSHAEQVPQDIGCHAGQANQDSVVVEIVVGHVIEIGSRCDLVVVSLEDNRNLRIDFHIFIIDPVLPPCNGAYRGLC
jgi:hypothetical protein